MRSSACWLWFFLTAVAFGQTEPARDSGDPVDPIDSAALDGSRLRSTAQGIEIADLDGGWHRTSLDVGLQQAALGWLAAARPQAGSIVVVEARTGAVLVWAEWPRPKSREDSLLLGRQLPSASLFKLVTAAALLDKAKISRERRVCTQGGEHRIETEHLLAPRVGLASCSPFGEALGFSRNAVFAQLAHRYLRPDDLTSYAQRFGFNEPLPFELPVMMGRVDIRGDALGLARSATGFVGSTLSPAGAAYLGLVVAQGGRAGQLHLLAEPTRGDDEPRPSVRVLTAGAAHELRRMMEVTVRRGTAASAFHDPSGQAVLPGIRIAAKTGTLGSDQGTTSWFVGFAPSHHPELVVTVLLENGPVWHKTAKQLAREVFLAHFQRPGRNSRGQTAEPTTVPRAARSSLSSTPAPDRSRPACDERQQQCPETGVRGRLDATTTTPALLGSGIAHPSVDDGLRRLASQAQ